jgi:hypothetical protein
MTRTNPYLLGLAGFVVTVAALAPGAVRSHGQERQTVPSVAYASQGSMPIREG